MRSSSTAIYSSFGANKWCPGHGTGLVFHLFCFLLRQETSFIKSETLLWLQKGRSSWYEVMNKSSYWAIWKWNSCNYIMPFRDIWFSIHVIFVHTFHQKSPFHLQIMQILCSIHKVGSIWLVISLVITILPFFVELYYIKFLSSKSNH